MDHATLAALRDARDTLRAERCGLEAILRDADKQPVAKLRLAEARVIVALAQLEEIAALARVNERERRAS
jgi:hypothetical protein